MADGNHKPGSIRRHRAPHIHAPATTMNALTGDWRYYTGYETAGGYGLNLSTQNPPKIRLFSSRTHVYQNCYSMLLQQHYKRSKEMVGMPNSENPGFFAIHIPLVSSHGMTTARSIIHEFNQHS